MDIRKTEDVFAFLEGLSVATWTATAIGVLFESGMIDAMSEPRTVPELASRCRAVGESRIRRCLDVAVANGLAVRDGDRYRLVDAMFALREPPFRTIAPADIRSALMQALAVLDASSGDRPSSGWRHEDPRVLRGQGEGSVMIVGMLQRRLVPALEGLAERLASPGARFLDVGVGVGALAVEMCRAFPSLAVVGLDTHAPALALARETIAETGMSERIELRQVPVEELRDEAGFDLAWLPSFFIPNVRAAAARICEAMRPGGWMVCALTGSGGSEKQNAAWALVGDSWGGEQLVPAEAAEVLRDAGFAVVRELPSPHPGVAFVGGRR